MAKKIDISKIKIGDKVLFEGVVRDKDDSFPPLYVKLKGDRICQFISRASVVAHYPAKKAKAKK